MKACHFKVAKLDVCIRPPFHKSGHIYVSVILQYKYNILVITQVRGKAKDAGNN